MKTTLLIMAAGIGSRFGGGIKQLAPVGLNPEAYIHPAGQSMLGELIARVQQNMTQKDLSAKTGITQADISRIENGTRNPSLSMVKKLAQGLGMQLKLEFVPMPTKNKM